MESNIRKLTYISFVCASAMAGLVAWYLTGTIFDLASLPSTLFFGEAGAEGTFSLQLTQLKMGIAVGVGAISFGVLFANTTAVEFTDEVFGELYKVTWPNRKETMASTLVVGVMVLVAALVFQIMDMVWGGIFGWIFS